MSANVMEEMLKEMKGMREEMRQMREEMREMREEMKKRDEKHELRLSIMEKAMRAGSLVPANEAAEDKAAEGQEDQVADVVSERHQEQVDVPLEGDVVEADGERRGHGDPLDRHIEEIRQFYERLRPGQEAIMTLRTIPDRIVRRVVKNDGMSEVVPTHTDKLGGEAETPRSEMEGMVAVEKPLVPCNPRALESIARWPTPDPGPRWKSLTPR